MTTGYNVDGWTEVVTGGACVARLYGAGRSRPERRTST